MSEIVYVSPKQTIKLVFTVLNSSQERTDAISLPIVAKVYKPDLTLLTGYPLSMTNIDVGIYSFNIILPIGFTAIGTYIATIIWTDPSTTKQKQTYYQIICKSHPNAAGEYVLTRSVL